MKFVHGSWLSLDQRQNDIQNMNNLFNTFENLT